LGQFVSGQRKLPAISHPLEFVCIPVYRSGADGLCVHLWDADNHTGPAAPTANHAHSWDLLSYVLMGTVRNELFDVFDDRTTPDDRVYEVLSRGDLDETRPTDRLVRHALRSMHEHCAGTVYSLQSGRYHRSSYSGPTVTIVYGFNHDTGRNVFLGPLSGGAPFSRRAPCSAAELSRCKELLDTVARAC